MKTSIYDRIPTMKNTELKRMVRFWAGICADRAVTPRRHDYYGKCLMRGMLELEKRRKRKPLPH